MLDINPDIKIEVINMREFVEPHKSYIEEAGMDIDVYASALRAFVLPEHPTTIWVSHLMEKDSNIYKRFISHETRHILDNASGLIPFETVTAADKESINKEILLKAETRAMTAESVHMTKESFERYKEHQFQNRNLYGFEEVDRETYFKAFKDAEEILA